jgi:prepilin-type N-terminal cleavage/methylation domain-containing protein
MTFCKPSQKGFTLLELVAVLIILSVLAALAIPRYIDLDAGSRQKAIDAGISELNGRESLTWSNIKISVTGWEDDATTFGSINTDLGADYIWTAGPNITGGTIKFGQSGAPVALNRTQSTDTRPGYWQR